MNSHTPSIHVFDSHEDADFAVAALNKAGFDVKKLSLVGKGFHSEEHPVGFYSVGDRMRSWGRTGAFWGGIWGLLLAPAVFFVPGIGVLTLAGPIVAALVSALEGAVVVGGVSAIGGALTQIGVPKDSAVKYEVALKADKFVLTVHGTSSDIADAQAILASAHVRESAEASVS